MPATNKGACRNCGKFHFSTRPTCDTCGARLSWANATASRSISPKTAPHEIARDVRRELKQQQQKEWNALNRGCLGYAIDLIVGVIILGLLLNSFGVEIPY